MQFDPIKLTVKAPGTKCLKQKYDDSLLSLGFKFNLRRYSEGGGGEGEGCGGDAGGAAAPD